MNPRSGQIRVKFNNSRFNIFYGLILFILAIFVLRLFYIQVIQHQKYKQAALNIQLKEYEIPAERGIIKAHDGSNIIPIVLNEEVFTLFADPVYVKDKHQAAQDLAKITGGNAKEYEDKMNTKTRYAVLAKKLDKDKKEAIEKLEIKGVGLRVNSKRVYAQGSLAAQLLGYVNDDGAGQYGVEQFFNNSLSGKPGEIKAITDSRGVPVVSNQDNILKQPEAGKDVTLTIDIGMQKKSEEILKKHLEEVNAKSGSVIVMNPNNGSVLAMANYPSYDPGKYTEVKDSSVFINEAVASPLEVGSIMKTLTIATGLNENVISPNTTFFDPAKYTVDGQTITDVVEDGGAQTRSIFDILKYSLNTGATWTLMQMGGGEINEKARKTWYDYLVNHYQFGRKTGIEQGYEAEGVVSDPVEGYGRNIKYANMSFGQGMTVTPLQMAAAFSATINGGTYYKPHLTESDDSKTNYVVRENVVSKKVSDEMRDLHERVVDSNYKFADRDGYRIGGKTGTAQIANPNGGYYEDKFNATFLGFTGGDKPEYVIMVRVDEPKSYSGYAGRAVAAPLFGKISDMILDNFPVSRAR